MFTHRRRRPATWNEENEMTEFLAKYVNPKFNLESRIAKRQDGKFAVTMFDIDSEQVFPFAHIYADLNKAHEVAKYIVGLEAA
jgi:hypothetical protein